MSSRARIVLAGWYGSDNTGDEALLEATVAALRTRGINDIHALSTNPVATSSKLGITSSPRNPFSPVTLRALRMADAFILGGGGLIQDRTSVYNLPLYALYVALARLLGLRVIGWGLGVEPLDTLLGKALARFICRAAAHFSVRDAGSKRLLAAAGVPPEQVAVTADPAFLLEPEQYIELTSEGERPVAVFCLRDLPDNRPGLNMHYLLPISVRRRLGLARSQRNPRTGRFVQAAARAVRLCVDEFGMAVVFVPLWPGRDDAITGEVTRAAHELGVPADKLKTIVERSPRRLAALVGGADLLVSMRLHALIFASGRGVPMLALAYARKMRGVMRLLGAERWVVEVESRTPSPEELEMKLRLLWEARQAQSSITREAARQAKARAEDDAEHIVALIAKE